MLHLIYLFQQLHTRKAFMGIQFSVTKFQANPIFFCDHLLFCGYWLLLLYLNLQIVSFLSPVLSITNFL